MAISVPTPGPSKMTLKNSDFWPFFRMYAKNDSEIKSGHLYLPNQVFDTFKYHCSHVEISVYRYRIRSIFDFPKNHDFFRFLKVFNRFYKDYKSIPALECAQQDLHKSDIFCTFHGF
jgi:hypothetical protein